ncbi:MAG: anhydro-N-acetylmuramic acid kinase, partial [Fidelibacterota bacterium]
EFQVLDTQTTLFQQAEREAIVRSLTGNADEVGALHFQLGEAYARVAESVLSGRSVDLVGCHGQTVAHRDGRYTLQVGTSAHVSQALNVPVVSNFREADMAVGGNGAPLMPFLDWLLCRGRSSATIVVNIGGVANISAIRPGMTRTEVVGFDTGPGMGLIDEAAQLLFEDSVDRDGRYSAEGVIREDVVAELMAHPFIEKNPPKSTGRDEFGAVEVRRVLEAYAPSPADLLRSLVRLTARSIASNVQRFVDFHAEVGTLIVSGGGVHHPQLMADLAVEHPGWKVVTSAELGIDPDFKEALLMAVLAVAHVERIPGNMPGVTGARKPVILGQIATG